MQFPIFSNDKDYNLHYEENMVKIIDENKFPPPLYKTEAIKERDNAVVIVLHRVKDGGYGRNPLFQTIAINKKELRDLIKSIMAEDNDSDIYCYNKLFDESYDKIINLLQYREYVASTMTAKLDNIECILYSVDIGVEGFIGTSLAVDIDYMKHDSYFIKSKLQDFEKELLSEYGPGIIQVNGVDICKKHDNSKYIRVSCTYVKEGKEDDKSINSNDD